MKLLITGATGFLGRYVVAEALRQGHRVRAVVRPTTNEARLTWAHHPDVELVRLDLRQKRGILEAVTGVDAVVHLAAAKSGDFYTQFAGTVISTENLLEAMVQANVLRLIVTSTFSMYDYLDLKLGALLDETSLIERYPANRDEYAQTKVIQEQMIREFEQEHNAQVTLLRPGIIYGREDLWHALLGMSLGNRLLCVAPNGLMPLAYVENCAEAIVKAIDAEAAIAQTINIVDDDQPSRCQYIRVLTDQLALPTTREGLPAAPGILSVNWFVIDILARFADFINQRFLSGQAKLPGILVPAKLHARFKPLRFSNSRAKQLLNWSPRYDFQTALTRSCSTEELLVVDVPVDAGVPLEVY